MVPSRQLGMYHEQYIVMWSLLVLTLIVFAKGIYERYKVWQVGQPEKRWQSEHASWKRFLSNSFGHLRLLRDKYPGIMHWLIFWGFVVFAIGTLSVMLEEDFKIPIYRGSYYLVLSFLLDIFGAGAIVGLLMALWRRYVIRPPRLDSNPDDGVTLLLILGIIVTGFILEGLRISFTKDPWAGWTPVGFMLAKSFSQMAETAQRNLHQVIWWIHLLLTFGFIAYIPHSKLFHIITGSLNQYLAKDKAAQALVPLNLEDENIEQFGIAEIQQFTWKQLMDGDACIRCGRCQDNCPAHLTQKPLSPKKFTQDLKNHLYERVEKFRQTNEEIGGLALVPEVIEEDVVWSCTTCRSCEEQCPVFVEHVPKIVDLRRNLVMMESNFPSEAQLAFRGMENNGNPWNIGWKSRADWAQELSVPLLVEDSEVEYLYWPGCSGAFDNRNKKVAIAVVKLLQKAGVSFGILGTEEKCCGDSARRLGNEYLFQNLAQENIETMNGYGVRKIITSCPHCYNTIKNEYPHFGGNYQVYHHSEFLAQLLKEGRLKPQKKLDLQCTYHDSCYLGRYNDIYTEPRAILDTITGLAVLEMERNREKGFCCGAGGGRMWLEEHIGKRINLERTEQALTTGANTIVTACPFCLTMLEDGTKMKNVNETIKTKDLAELLWESLN
ncbi:Fe-S oxidoreductase [Carboxydocella sporoproducens DSM 16521]|uniref:Fe-S oxidoreductase n=3 Tax=Carboxydocella TaxID=178898 RepID=A0A1T4LTZ8_9FIRM|nr:Fe-S oxidoreductase [Carboxydocella thermautotrophica]AVX31026.1 Fe-S oxidoreductase [Carboxydocella thermautotrophica]SJZ58008.1 Fe-S oxidoreductase [Carboxydocella sporoproducens DSM 16521]